MALAAYSPIDMKLSKSLKPMSARIFLVAVASLFFQWKAHGQSPAYFNTTVSGTYNSIPLNHASNRVQWIYGPHVFNSNGTSGSPAIKGRIDTLYFRLGVVYLQYPVFSNLTIKLAQNVDTANSWNSTAWHTGMTTVFYARDYLVKDTQGAWVKIPLQTTFNYNPDLSLVVEMSVSSGTGCDVKLVVGSVNERRFGGIQNPSAYSYAPGLLIMGMNIVSIPSNDAGITRLTEPVNFCAGKHLVKVNLINGGRNRIDSVRVNWSIDGVIQPPVFDTTPIDTQGKGNWESRIVTLGSDSFPVGTMKKLKVWTSYPNGMVDSGNANDTIEWLLKPALNGTYTIGDTNADYSSISAAASDLNNYGICGPVQFNIDTGTYDERVVIKEIGGISASKTVTFRGVDRDKTIVQHKGTWFSDLQTILLNGANHVTIKNLTIRTMDETYGVGVHLVDADHNLIDSCNIYLSDSSYSIKLFGVSASGTPSEPIYPGNSGDSNTVSNNKIHGGYYGIHYTGGSSVMLRNGVSISGNNITGFLRYGMNFYYLNNLTVQRNSISCLRSPDVLGMIMSAINNYHITDNYIYVTANSFRLEAGNYFSYVPGRQSLITNNMISTTATTGPEYYGFIYLYSKHTNIYHNSIFTEASFTTSFGVMDSTDIRNNIFINNQGGRVIGVGSSRFTPDHRFDNNVYHSSAKYIPVAFQGTLYNTIAAWFNSDTSMNKGSFDQDAYVISGSNLRLKPGDRPKGPYLGIDYDIDGQIRCLSPNIGADEIINETMPDTANPSVVCYGSKLVLNLPTPDGRSNSSYDSTWTFDSVYLLSESGDTNYNWTFSAPSGTGGGSVIFTPSRADAGKSFVLNLIIRDLAISGCYTRYGKLIDVWESPEVLFTVSDTIVCNSDTLTVSIDSFSSNYTGFEFTMGDGNRRYQDSFIYTYRNPGTYNLTLAITGKNGCIGRLVKQVEVLPEPRPEFYFSGQCAETTVYFTDSTAASDSAISWLWAFGDGDSSALQNPSHHYDSAGIYEVKLNVSAVNGCAAEHTKQLSIITPHVDFSTGPLCNGLPVQFNNLSAPLSGSGFKWHFGNGDSSEIQNPSVTFSGAGNYMVSLQVTDSSGCENSIDRMIPIYEVPNVNFDVDTGCSGAPLTFRNNAVPQKGSAFTWRFGNGDSSTSTNPSYTYQLPGNYTVELLATDTNGCKARQDKMVTIDETPEARFTADSVCSGDATSFSNLSAPSTGLTYYWQFGDGQKSSIFQMQHVYPDEGIYTVSLEVANDNGTCRDTMTGSVLVYALPEVTFSIDHLTSKEKRFTPSDTGFISYKWHFGDGDSSVLVMPTHEYTADSGQFAVSLTVTDSNGCASENTGIAHVWATGVYVAESNFVFKVFPNPFTHIALIALDLTAGSQVNMILHDLYERRIAVLEDQRKPVGQHNYYLDADQLNLAPGVYFLSVTIGDTAFTKKIILSD